MDVKSAPIVERIETQVFQIPTDRPESDGTLEWDSAPWCWSTPGLEGYGLHLCQRCYGFELAWFRRLLESGAVDVLQADATRCGMTGFLQVTPASSSPMCRSVVQHTRLDSRQAETLITTIAYSHGECPAPTSTVHSLCRFALTIICVVGSIPML